MQVILIEDVDNLGQIGDQVKVKNGYARNFLLPKHLAIPASTGHARRLAHERRLAELKAAKAKADDQATAKKLSGTTVTIARKVGENDKLYGSVTAIDVEQALSEGGLPISRRKILIDEPIKALGSYDVTVRLRADVETTVKVHVVADAS